MTLNRRQALATLAASTSIAALAPRYTIGASRSKDESLRIAGIGIGGRGFADLKSMQNHPAFKLTAVCDVDKRFYENGRKIQNDVPGCQDYRELFRNQADTFDAVLIATPDHMHAPIAKMAMDHGKHVYLQKPLAQDIGECRMLAECAAQNPELVTQMGIQIHSHAAYRTAVKWIQSGLIGTVNEVHSWSGKGWGGELADKPESAVPDYLDWDLYCGVSEKRPYVEGYYHRNNWRKWLAFGTGTQGDMGCHIVDPVFTALKLKEPTTVTSFGPKPFKHNFALISKVAYTFKGTPFTTDRVQLTWYNGSLRPTKLAHLPADANLPGQGSVLIGDQGSMILPHIGNPIVFSPDGKPMTKLPEMAAHANHFHDWIDACLGKKEKATAHFEYSGPLTEAVLMGTVINRWPETEFSWDAANCRFLGSGEKVAQANALLRPAYRTGW